MHLYRILTGDALSDKDLESYSEMTPDRYKDHCRAHGISLYKNFRDALNAYNEAKNIRKRILGTHVAEIEIKKDHGILYSKDESHFTLWLYKKVDAALLKCLKIEKIQDC